MLDPGSLGTRYQLIAGALQVQLASVATSTLRKWRAAADLARLHHDQRRCADARDRPASVYRWFTAGFDTADLQAAGALLNDLENSAAIGLASVRS